MSRLLSVQPCRNILPFKETENRIQRLFVGLPGGIGDLVLAMPSVDALKKKYPQAEITFGVGGEPFRSAIECNPNIDKILSPFTYDQCGGLRDRFDKMILLQIPKDPFKWRKKLKRWLRKNGLLNIREDHLIDQYARLAGVELAERRPVIYLSQEDETAGRRILERMGAGPGDLLVSLCHTVGQSRFFRSWPLKSFEELIGRIQREAPCKIMVFGAPGDPELKNKGLVHHLGLSLRPTAYLIKQSDLFIGMDSGLTHIAASFDCRIVSIHIGYSTGFSGALSPHASVLHNGWGQGPETYSVDEVYSAVKEKLDQIRAAKSKHAGT